MTRPHRENTTYAHGDRGAVMVFAILIVVVLLLVAGLVVDVGQQRAAARDAQADADVIALDMARLSDGNTTISVLAGSNHTVILGELNASAGRNQVEGSASKDDGTTADNAGRILLLDGDDLRLEVQWGWLSEDPDPTQCGQQTQVRDETDSPWFAECTLGSQTPNAARVTAYDSVGFRLLPVGNGPSRGGVVRTAYARHGSQELVSFRMGSYLLDGVDEGVLDDLFSRLLGSSVDLQAVHYNGLAAHRLTIANIADLSGITGSPSEVLDQTITFHQLAEATIEMLRRNNDGSLSEANIQALEAVFLNTTLIASEPIRLGDLVAADPTNPDSALDAKVSALDFLQTGTHLAQCKPGSTGTWNCHGVVFDDLVAGVGGVALVGSPQTHVIEGPRVYTGSGFNSDGTPATLRTSQVGTSVGLAVTSSPGAVGNCGLLALNCLLSNLLGNLLGTIGTIGLVDITGAISVDLVGGKAQVQDLCYNQAQRDLDLLATTSLYDVEARIDIKLENRVPVLLSAPKITPFTISLVLSNTAPANSQAVTFTDPGAMGPIPVGGGSVGLSGLDVAFEVNGSLVGIGVIDSLLNLLSNNLLRPLIGNLTGTLKQSIAPRVDSLVGALSDRLGVNLTGADLEGLFVRCGDYGVQLVG